MSSRVIKLRCICGLEIPTLEVSDHQEGYFCPRCKDRMWIVATSHGTPSAPEASAQTDGDGRRIRSEVEAMEWPEVIGE